MKTGADDSNRQDIAALLAAALCALHCLFARRLPSALGGSTAHLAVAVAVVGMSGSAIGSGWMKHHEGRVWSWGGFGWLGLLLARAGSGRGMNEGAEVIVTVLSCGLLFMAHLLNRSLCYWHDKD